MMREHVMREIKKCRQELAMLAALADPQRIRVQEASREMVDGYDGVVLDVQVGPITIQKGWSNTQEVKWTVSFKFLIPRALLLPGGSESIEGYARSFFKDKEIYILNAVWGNLQNYPTYPRESDEHECYMDTHSREKPYQIQNVKDSCHAGGSTASGYLFGNVKVSRKSIIRDERDTW